MQAPKSGCLVSLSDGWLGMSPLLQLVQQTLGIPFHGHQVSFPRLAVEETILQGVHRENSAQYAVSSLIANEIGGLFINC